MCFSRYSGFTLIELLVVISIAGILLVYAVPSYTEFSKNNSLISERRELVDLIGYSRSEAVRLGRNVFVEVLDDSPSATNEWGAEGYRSWADLNRDGDFDAGEELRLVERSPASITLDSLTNTTQFVFRSNGMTDSNVSFHICDDRTGETGEGIAILGGGKVNVNVNVSVGDLTCL